MRAVEGEVGHAGAGTIDGNARRLSARLASRLAWLRGFVHIETDARAIAALDGVRGLAASLVFIVHYQAAFGRLLADQPGAFAAGQYAALVGYHGVNLFFVLSGFLIYGSLVGRPVPLKKFLRRRVRRIYPTFLAVLALYLTLGQLLAVRDKLPHVGTVAYVLANVALLPGVFPIKPIITVSWSLSYEIFYYLGIAALVTWLGMRRWSVRQRVGFFVALVFLWALSGAGGQRVIGSFIMFVPGILLWELSQLPAADKIRARVHPAIVWGGLVAALLAVPAFAMPPLEQGLRTFGISPAVIVFGLLALAMPLLLLHALGAGGMVARMLGSESLRFVGVVSYSFYLIHGVAINVLALLFWRVAGPHPPHGLLLYFALLPAVYGAAVLMALLLFRAVEQRLSL